MNWEQDLVQLYDLIKDNDESEDSLPAVFWAKVRANIRICLYSNGDLKTIKVILPDEDQVFIPVTEGAQSRTKGNCPYPVHDKLKYLIPSLVPAKQAENDPYQMYVAQLSNICQITENMSFQAVLTYISSGTMAEDLVKADILIPDGAGYAIGAEGRKAKVGKVKDLFAYFEVEDSDNATDEEDWESYITQISEDGTVLSAITGEEQSLVRFAPAVFGKSKLISGNDDSGFTYRGRFSNMEEALSLGYQDVAKMHLALNWLLATHYVHFGSSTDVALIWPSNLEEDPYSHIEWFMNSTQNEDTVNRFLKNGMGYRADSKINILFLEKVSDGRTAVQGYQTVSTPEFLNRLNTWFDTTSWICSGFNKEDTSPRMPGLERLVDCIYGRETKDSFFKMENKTMRSRLIKNLLKSAIGGNPIPRDIPMTASRAAARRTSYSEWGWERVNDAACCVIRRYYHDYLGKDYNFMLEKDNTDRSYLFGRLLGLAEYIERSAVRGKGGKGSGSTNASRLMSAFAQTPSKTYAQIHDRLTPYKNALYRSNYGYAARADRQMEEIMDLLSVNDFQSNKPLDPAYILGRSHQLRYMYTKEEKEDQSKKEISES